jgi:transmembrane sensor
MSEILIDITILELLHKKLKEGTLLPAEKELLENWERSSVHHRALADRIGNHKALLTDLSERYALNGDLAWKRVAARTMEKEAAPVMAPVRRIRAIRRWWAAAAILLLAGIGTYFWATIPKDNATPIVENRSSDIPAGREGAVLTLADGSQVSLDTIQNATIAQQGGVTARVVDGTLRYEGTGNEIMYNTVSTPKGRMYRVILPDGTIAWLNAASHIKYPSAFSGAHRKVELKGEAYFEVAKDPIRPFFVKINETTSIEVLGTSFNVNAYSNEISINTTLLEGKVKVMAAANFRLLLPGRQALVENNYIKVIDADTDKVMAWKNGLFDFTDASFASMMRQLERWYDIEVVYENGIPDLALTGKISRDVTLQGLLKNLERMGVHCQLKERKLIVQ